MRSVQNGTAVPGGEPVPVRDASYACQVSSNVDNPRFADPRRLATWKVALRRTWDAEGALYGSVWLVLFLFAVMVPGGIVYALLVPGQRAAGIGVSILFLPVFAYWICGRPYDRRDPFALSVMRHTRVVSVIGAIAFVSFSMACLVRAVTVFREHPDLRGRLLAGLIVGVVSCVVWLLPVLRHWSAGWQLVCSIPPALVLLAASMIVFPRGPSTSSVSELAFWLPVAMLTYLACAGAMTWFGLLGRGRPWY